MLHSPRDRARTSPGDACPPSGRSPRRRVLASRAGRRPHELDTRSSVGYASPPAAVAAARAVVDGLAELSASLRAEFPEPLRVGIGIHAGPAVVGWMGYGEAMYLTAVGDTVHVASRLQDLTKEYDCQLVISEDVAAVAGIDASPFPRHEIHARNREQPLAIRVIDDVRRIAMA